MNTKYKLLAVAALLLSLNVNAGGSGKRKPPAENYQLPKVLINWVNVKNG